MQSIETANHTYTISLTVERCDRIHSKFKLDLLDDQAQNVFNELALRPRTRLGIMWEMVDDKSECPRGKNPDFDPDIPKFVDDKPNPDYINELMSSKQTFMDLLEGEVLKSSEEAFWEEVSFFFQNLNPVMAKYLEGMKEKSKEFSQNVMEQLDNLMMGEGMKKATDKEIQKAFKEAEKQLEKLSGS